MPLGGYRGVRQLQYDKKLYKFQRHTSN